VVALGAAVLGALVVAALLTAGRPQSQAGPSPTAVSAAAATAGPTVGPAGLVRAVQASIQTQVQAGQLDPDAANDLDNKLDEIVRRLTKGDIDKAAEKVTELGTRLAELRKDGKITTAGYNAVLASLDQLRDSFPAANGEHD
jgi:serine/threonine-protein kinase